MVTEPYTVTCGIHTWTRNTLKGSMALADNISRMFGTPAIVQLTETGWVEYTSNPVVKEEIKEKQ